MGDENDLAEQSREDIILGGGDPLNTLLQQSVGPFFSQVSNSMYGFVNTIWLANYVSEISTTALSTASAIDYIALGFGIFLSVSASSKIASLFGERRTTPTSQVISDLIRLSIILGILIPSLLLPISRPMMRWLGASEIVVNLGFDYLQPVLYGSVFSCMYLLLCGCLQAEGRTYLFAIMQIISLILNSLVFNPIFLIIFKWGIFGSGLSTIVSQALPSIGLLLSFYFGKFTVQISTAELFNEPIPETYEALQTGFSSLIGAVSATLPSVIFQKFLGLSCSSDYEFNIMMSLYNAFTRTYSLAIALYMALSSGYLPAASYAFSAKNYDRVIMLLIHATWIIVVISIITLSIMIGFPRQISSIFSSDPFFHQRYLDCRIASWITAPLCSSQYIATAFLQSVQHTGWALISSFMTQLAIWPISSAIVFYTDQHNPVRLFYAVIGNDVASFIFIIPFITLSIIGLFSGVIQDPNSNEVQINSNQTSNDAFNNSCHNEDPCLNDNIGFNSSSNNIQISNQNGII